LSSSQCYDILSNISKDDSLSLGFSRYSHPKDLMIKYLLVCPPQCRPSIQRTPMQMDLDDISKIYLKIIKLNKEIKPCELDSEKKL